jgi:hypothetical protein
VAGQLGGTTRLCSPARDSARAFRAIRPFGFVRRNHPVARGGSLIRDRDHCSSRSIWEALQLMFPTHGIAVDNPGYPDANALMSFGSSTSAECCRRYLLCLKLVVSTWKPADLATRLTRPTRPRTEKQFRMIRRPDALSATCPRRVPQQTPGQTQRTKLPCQMAAVKVWTSHQCQSR